MINKMTILLVEDDPNLSDVLRDYLDLLGYNVVYADDGEEGLKLFKQSGIDLCILDVMMPKKDGFALARDIRLINQQVPIIFLTARGMMEDRITGFKAGCDDYISKPFSSEELSLRIEAILRRCISPAGKAGMLIQLGGYIFDVDNFELVRDGEHHSLTPKEAAILRILCNHKNQLVTREKVMQEVWGDDNYFIGRSMDVFITKLRKYLKEDNRVAITNVHGTGYRLEVPE